MATNLPTPTVDLSTADVAENMKSYKTKSVALRVALEWARMNTVVGNVEDVVLGQPFEVTYWNGGYNVPAWLVYSVSTTDEGFTVTAYRWFSNPTNKTEEV